MARTRAQLAAQKGPASSAPNDRGKRPQGIRTRRSPRQTTRLQRLAPKHTEYNQRHPSPTKKTLPQQDSATPNKRGSKRPAEALDHDTSALQKRRRVNSATDNGSPNDPIDPIAFWTREGQWPREFFDRDMEHLLARKKSSSNLSRKRSNSASSTTPSDQRAREEKSAPYKDSRYPLLLQTKGSYMGKSALGTTDESKRLCQALLDGEQPVPKESLFDHDIFENACENIENKNEARVIQDVSRLIVPSAETLALRAKDLKRLTESVNEGWNNSLPLTRIRPQPDYSVGFRREAFTDDQLAKLSPFIGDFIAGDQSIFMATYYMYFPFLTCEVKCGAAALDVADRQNAHSMTLAVRAIAELFRAVKREDEVHRQILAFSISHDHRSVRIYGHYPVLEGKDTKYYRHPIHEFFFTALNGKEKWTAYRFTKNIYDIWMPAHFMKICSAIDQLPSNLDFDVLPLAEATGLSQNLGSLLSDVDSTSLPVEQDSQPSHADQKEQGATPGTSFMEPQEPKRRRGAKK